MRNSFLPQKNSRIAVGVSGGVDSSVAAYLLKEQGYDVFGIFMKNWEDSFSAGYCNVEEDLQDAKDVCESIGIPLHTVNFVKAYHEKVFRLFLDEYRAGRTPNPDVLCNREIKFAELAHYADSLGADYLATGHYAKRVQINDTPYLYKADDITKDQSYFLHQITHSQLSKAIFPLGELQKSEVRKIAESIPLITYDKKDSTGICFIGERPFKDFLQNYLPAQPGNIVDVEGNIIGQHSGLMYYTIGQRQGLGIGGIAGKTEAPWYVVEKNLSNNQLIVAQGEHPLLFNNHLIAGQLSWLNEPPVAGKSYQAKIRYRQTDQTCQVSWVDDKLSVKFSEPQRAVTLGQYIVLYDNSQCLGGGVIEYRGNQA